MTVKAVKLNQRQLKQLISEIVVSPSLFNKDLESANPLDRRGVVLALRELERNFNDGISANLLISNVDMYDFDSRNFDDATYKQISDIADEVTNRTIARISDVLVAAWNQAQALAAASKKNQRVSEAKKLIVDEYLRGIPEFALRQATEKYVDEIRQHVFRFILANKSQTSADQRAACAAANEVLDELETKANDLLEDELWSFMRRV